MALLFIGCIPDGKPMGALFIGYIPDAKRMGALYIGYIPDGKLMGLIGYIPDGKNMRLDGTTTTLDGSTTARLAGSVELLTTGTCGAFRADDVQFGLCADDFVGPSSSGKTLKLGSLKVSISLKQTIP